MPDSRRRELLQALQPNGATIVPLASATHIVTNTPGFIGADAVPENVHVVSDFWVDRCMVLGELLDPQFYSMEHGKIFSGVIGCATGLSAADLTVLKTGVTSLGGSWRMGLTREVTHLFAISPNSDKYVAAMAHKDKTQIKILLPHWFDDAVRVGSARLNTQAYEWPDPQVLKPMPTERPERRGYTVSHEKQLYFKTGAWDPHQAANFPAVSEPTGEDDIWKKRRVLLSRSLDLDPQRRSVLEQAIETAGGRIVAASKASKFDDDECEKLKNCDVYITRYRSGRAFFQAVERDMLIGTVHWVLYVHAARVLSSPMDHLLHYPIRNTPVEGDFTKQQITVTNYTGEIREYLKALIRTMGASFTPNMTGTNTLLIAAHMGGIKTEKALSWSIPVVNHVWLEDCFAQWLFLSPALSKYIHFPPHVDFTSMLAERGMLRSIDDLAVEEKEDARRRNRERPPIGTDASAKEVQSMLSAEDVDMEDEDETERRRRPATDKKRAVSASVSPSKSAKHVTKAESVSPSKTPSKKRPQPANNSPAKRHGKPASLFSEEEEDKPKPNGNAKGKATASSKPSRSAPKRKIASDVESEEEEEPFNQPPPAKRAKTTSNASRPPPQTKAAQDKLIILSAAQTGSVPARILARQRLKQETRAEDDGEDAEMPDVGQDSGSGKQPQRTRARKNENSAQSTQAKGKAKAKAGKKDTSANSSSRSTKSEAIRILTTMVSLEPGVVKKLTKLGVKMADKVEECTHLIAPGIVRTEKFLLALANGAWMLSADWAIKSAREDYIQSEEAFMLSDDANEKKWGFTLKEAMKRANEPGKLFDGMTFYVTKSVSVDSKLLKAVVEAQGGKIGTPNPTVRIATSDPKRFVISCDEDEGVWRQIANKRKIYTPELLLLGALKQELEFNNPDFVLAERKRVGLPALTISNRIFYSVAHLFEVDSSSRQTRAKCTDQP
uniref:BRCT domain-containing protein n=1 Tax=Mycena chlorophos TaxID=658473 RepID=A0ABQ0MB49_MYCCL|nr:predicted protein [Mycena chlorophos]